MSVAVAGVVGYLLLLAMTMAIGSIPAVLSAKDAEGNAIPAAIAVFQQALGAKAGNAMSAVAAVAMWFCGLSCITSASRALYSLARDNGTPAAGALSRVNERHGTPGPAIWAIVAASLIAMLWTGGIPVVTSLSTVSLYVAYVVPVFLGLRARSARPDWTKNAVWTLGRYGYAVNAIAIVYTGAICVILVMPPNVLAGQTFAGLCVALTLLYLGRARHFYKGPEWSKHHG
jgi:amino acid transporter